MWTGECSDAHIFESSFTNDYDFSHGGRKNRLELIGFYNRLGQFTRTFWACELNECFGTVKLQIRDITPAAAVPVDSGMALIVTALLLGAFGGLRLRRQ